MLVRSRWLVFHLHLRRCRSGEATNVAQQYLERQSRFRRTFSGKIYTLQEFLQVLLASSLCLFLFRGLGSSLLPREALASSAVLLPPVSTSSVKFCATGVLGLWQLSKSVTPRTLP